MTEEEYSQWQRRLFVCFPSYHSWLRDSFAPKETQVVWRETLRRYSLDECNGVLYRWTSGDLQPPEAYQRDQIALCVAAVINRDRSLARRKDESLRLVAEGRKRETAGQRLTPMAPVLAGALRMRQDGATEDEVRTFVEAEVQKL